MRKTINKKSRSASITAVRLISFFREMMMSLDRRREREGLIFLYSLEYLFGLLGEHLVKRHADNPRQDIKDHGGKNDEHQHQYGLDRIGQHNPVPLILAGHDIVGQAPGKMYAEIEHRQDQDDVDKGGERRICEKPRVGHEKTHCAKRGKEPPVNLPMMPGTRVGLIRRPPG